MRFSEIFKSVNFRVDLLVDNATTQTKAEIDINMFSKGINKANPVEFLRWTDGSNNEQVVYYYFRRGDLKDKSKGLFVLCKELNIIDDNTNFNDILLPELKKKAEKHPAFKKTSKLEYLVNKFNKEFQINITLNFITSQSFTAS